MNLELSDDDLDDPIVWQRGKLLEDGRALISIMRRSDEARMLAARGREWLNAYLARKEAEVSAFGVM